MWTSIIIIPIIPIILSAVVFHKLRNLYLFSDCCLFTVTLHFPLLKPKNKTIVADLKLGVMWQWLYCTLLSMTRYFSSTEGNMTHKQFYVSQHPFDFQNVVVDDEKMQSHLTSLLFRHTSEIFTELNYDSERSLFLPLFCRSM